MLWLDDEGCAHIRAFLAALDLSAFDPKAPPPKTAAWREIVSAGRAPEEAELASVIDAMGSPDALTLKQLEAATARDMDFGMWLRDRRNRRTIPFRLEAAGYVAVGNTDNEGGYWRVDGCAAEDLRPRRAVRGRSLARRCRTCSDAGHPEPAVMAVMTVNSISNIHPIYPLLRMII